MVVRYFGRICIRLRAEELSISAFSGCFFDFLPLNLLLVRSHQAEIIIVKHLIFYPRCNPHNNMSDEGGSWFKITQLWSHSCHKNSTLTLSATLNIIKTGSKANPVHIRYIYNTVYLIWLVWLSKIFGNCCNKLKFFARVSQ